MISPDAVSVALEFTMTNVVRKLAPFATWGKKYRCCACRAEDSAQKANKTEPVNIFFIGEASFVVAGCFERWWGDSTASQ